MFPPLVSLWRPRRAGNPALRNVPRPHVPPIQQAVHPCGDKDDLSPNNCPGSQLVILFVDCNKIVARQSIVSCDNFKCNYSILQIIDFAGKFHRALRTRRRRLLASPYAAAVVDYFTGRRSPRVPHDGCFTRLVRRLLAKTLCAPVPPAYFTSFSLGDFVDSSPGLTLKPSL